MLASLSLQAFRELQDDLVLDGELVICDDLGRPVFERLKARASKRKPESTRKGAAEDPAAMFAFDLLWLNGEDYRHCPFTIRKAMLAPTLKAGGVSNTLSTQRTQPRVVDTREAAAA